MIFFALLPSVSLTVEQGTFVLVVLTGILIFGPLVQAFEAILYLVKVIWRRFSTAEKLDSAIQTLYQLPSFFDLVIMFQNDHPLLDDLEVALGDLRRHHHECLLLMMEQRSKSEACWLPYRLSPVARTELSNARQRFREFKSEVKNFERRIGDAIRNPPNPIVKQDLPGGSTKRTNPGPDEGEKEKLRVQGANKPITEPRENGSQSV